MDVQRPDRPSVQLHRHTQHPTHVQLVDHAGWRSPCRSPRGLAVDLDQVQPNAGNLALLRGELGLVEEPRLGLQVDTEHLVAYSPTTAGSSSVAAAHTQTASGRSDIGADERRDQPTGAAAGRAARLVTPERHRPMVRQQHYRQIRAGKRHRIPISLLLRSALPVRTATSARPGPGAKAARSRSDSPPQTPYRSPYWIA
jgi:hypothetical protein